MDSDEKIKIFTEKLVAGTRTYFFDVKEAKDGAKYLVISESKHIGSRYEHNRVMVFEEHLQAFAEIFQKTVKVLGVKKNKLADTRKTCPMAYKRWTPNADQQLKALYQNGVPITELADYFQRRPNAIRSRLAKLGLLLSPVNKAKKR